MYYLNSCKTGKIVFQFQAYDDAISYLEDNEYFALTIIPDSRMEGKGKPLANVWWICTENDDPSYMLTSCEPAFNIRKD